MKLSSSVFLRTLLPVLALSFHCCIIAANAESNTALMKKAVEEYRTGNFVDAAGHFYATLTTQFSNPLVHYYMASCYVHLEDPESAVREFRIAYALSPNSDVGYYSKTALNYFVFNADGSAVALARKDKKSNGAHGGATGVNGSGGSGSGSGGAGKEGELRSADSGMGPSHPASGASPGGAAGNAIGSASGNLNGASNGTSNGTSSVSSSGNLSGAVNGSSNSTSEVIQSQLQREKDARLSQSQKLAEEINKQGTERYNKAVSGLSTDPVERQQQILRLPDDVKALLNNLKYEYDTRRQKQLDLGKTQAQNLDESAANLQSLIDQHQSLQAGSNLYVRHYKKDPPKGASNK